MTAATEQWPRDGIPENPRAWLVSTGRFKAIDHLRRRARYDHSLEEAAQQLHAAIRPIAIRWTAFGRRPAATYLHLLPPSIAQPEARTALTLREVCGLTTEEIARAFLTSAPTVAKRIVRAKAKIRVSRIPYEVPARADLHERLDSVLQVTYLVFTEGYSACSGASLTRADLSQEAIRLGRLLLELLRSRRFLGCWR